MAEKKVQIDIVIESAAAANSLRDIKTSLRDVNNELLKTEEGTAEYAKLANAAGKLKDKLGDLNDTLKTTQGSGLEKFKNSLSLIREGFTNLDPGKLSTGIKGATQAFGGLGKAILATGIGALVIGVGALIANFDKLKNVGGLVGKVFSGIGDIIDTVTTGLTKLSNSWGLTAIQTEKATEETLAYNKALQDVNLSIEEAAIEEKLLNGQITEGVAARQKAEEKKNKALADAEAEAEEVRAKYRGIAADKLTEAQKKELDQTLTLFEQKTTLAETQFSNDIKRIENNEKAKADATAKAQREAAEKLAKERAAEAKKKAEENQKEIDDFLEKSLDGAENNAKKLAELRRKIANESEKQKIDREEKEDLAEAERLFESEEGKLKIREFYAKKRKELEERTNQEIAEQEKESEDEQKAQRQKRVDSIKENIEKEIQLNLEKIDRIKEASQAGIDIINSLGQVVADNRAADLEVEATNLEANYQRRKEYIEKNVQDETQRAIQLNALDTEINNSRNQIERKKIELEKQGIKRERAIAIGEIALSTAIAISKAVAATSKTDPVTFALSLAANVGAVIATIAKANNALKKADAAYSAVGAGGGGGSTPLPSASTSTPEAQTPNAFALFGTGGNANNLGGPNGPQLIQAYVVESDISSVQRRVERFRTASEL